MTPETLDATLIDLAAKLAGNKLADYEPYPKQRDFHASGGPLTIRERLLKAGNQVGKTWSAGFEHAMHLTGRYPDWWTGAVFDEPTIGWAASETGQTTRDTVQRILLGQVGSWGTGAIPRDAIIGDPKRAAGGVPDLVETILVRHGGGGDVQAAAHQVARRSLKGALVAVHPQPADAQHRVRGHAQARQQRGRVRRGRQRRDGESER
jgi:hypothetical protein